MARRQIIGGGAHELQVGGGSAARRGRRRALAGGTEFVTNVFRKRDFNSGVLVAGLVKSWVLKRKLLSC